MKSTHKREKIHSDAVQWCYEDNLSPATFPPLALKQQKQAGTIEARVGPLHKKRKAKEKGWDFVKLGYVYETDCVRGQWQTHGRHWC